MDAKKIGRIGLGRMGYPMAVHSVRAGRDVPLRNTKLAVIIPTEARQKSMSRITRRYCPAMLEGARPFTA